MVRKGRIKSIQSSSHTNRDIGQVEPLFGKAIRFEAPKDKYSRNDYVEFEMRSGKAWILRRAKAPSEQKGRLRTRSG
ncbi:hypothetical protein KY335_01300 [Candidatus Woesearchaeota archaeon]|nr:hypothetical protein [Candidatus Woesearchaeota archaeon]